MFYFSKQLPEHNKLKLPTLSPSMETGTIVEWKIKEGDEFNPGDGIASIETDKAVVDFEVNESGYLAKIIHDTGAKDIPLGTVIAITVEEKEDVAAFADYEYNEKSSNSNSAKESKKKDEDNYKEENVQDKVKQNNTEHLKEDTEKVVSKSNTKESNYSDRLFVSPLAKKTAEEEGIDISNIKGTGPKGRILYEDIKDYLKSTTSKTNKQQQPTQEIQSKSNVLSTQNEYEDIPVSNIRKVIAKRLLLSKTTIPHFYLNAECKVDKLVKLREKLNKVSEVKVSFNDIILKACAIACQKVPEANSVWNDKTIRMNKNVDISVAVQTDNGLITPIIFNAHTKRIGEISKEVKSLAAKAREGKLKPNEFQGGTFTVSNLGMMGITSFSAIINPGQSCILAVGKMEKKVVYNDAAIDKNMPFKVVNVINVTLSCDHRTVDGAVGAKWVNEFRSMLEDPELLLL